MPLVKPPLCDFIYFYFSCKSFIASPRQRPFSTPTIRTPNEFGCFLFFIYPLTRRLPLREHHIRFFFFFSFSWIFFSSLYCVCLYIYICFFFVYVTFLVYVCACVCMCVYYLHHHHLNFFFLTLDYFLSSSIIKYYY